MSSNNKTATQLYSICLQLPKLLLFCTISYKLFQSFKKETITNKTPKHIKLCMIAWICADILWSISYVIINIAFYIQLNPLIYVTGSTLKIWDIIMYSSVAYFLKQKLEHTYKDTFLSVNKQFTTIIFIIYVILLCPAYIGQIIVVDIIYWYPSLKQYKQVTRIIHYTFTITETIYYLLMIILFNIKLYQFISFTMNNNALLSSRINNKLTNSIVKQTNVISVIIFNELIYEIIWYIRWFSPKNDNNNTLDIIYETMTAIYEFNILISFYLSCKFNDKWYYMFCRYSHSLCLNRCNKLVKNDNAAKFSISNDYRLFSVNKNDYNINDININDNYIYMNQQSDITVCNKQADCEYIQKICDLLTRNADYYEIDSILDQFYHLLCCHDSEYYFALIYNRLCANGKICDINNCQRFQRNNRRRHHSDTNIDYNTAKENILCNIHDKLHAFYFHSYDTFFRIRSSKSLNINEKMKFINSMKRKDYYNRNRMRVKKFNSNIEINDSSIDNIGNNMCYSFGQRFEYEDEKLDWFVHPKYSNIKDELINNEICTITISDYSIEFNKASIFNRTNYVKTLQNQNKHHELTVPSLLSLLIYINCDLFQNRWSATFRRITQNESNKSLKQRHSNFYFVSKYIRDLTERFGKRLNTDNAIQRFYHGIDAVKYFDRTITKFFGPLSTSSEIMVAHNFSAGNGLVLELKYKFSKFPLLSKYFPCSFFSDFVAEKECLFIGGIPMLIITNIINVSNNNEIYEKYVYGLNVINSIMNGTYDINHERTHMHINHDILCSKLLMYANNENNNNALPKYIVTLLNKYCMNLQNVVLFWDNIFGKNNDQNNKLKKLLNHEEINVFIDLNKMCELLFPNLVQIEWYKESLYSNGLNNNSSINILKRIINYILNTDFIRDNNKLKYVIIHHKMKNRIRSILPNMNMDNAWKIYGDSKKVVFFREMNLNVANIKCYFDDVKQGYTSQNMLNNMI